MNETPIIGFIGAGRMAAALARGFVDSGLVAPENLIASDPVPAGRKAFGQAVGCETTDSNADVLAKAKVIFWHSSRINSTRQWRRCATSLTGAIS